jgi:16S rRNA (cytosine967-C5)-methyltransferase
MRKKQPRDLALSALSRGDKRSGQWGDPLSELFTQNPHLTERDRAFINHLVQGVWRWRGQLDWIIGRLSNRPLKKISPIVINILRLAVYQIRFMDRVPDSAAVDEAVKQAKRHGAGRAAPFVNGLLRSFCRDRDGIEFPDPSRSTIRYLSAYHSFPEWLVSRWVDTFGREAAEALLESQNKIPGLDIRINSLKTNPDELMELLEAESVLAEPVPLIPGALCLKGVKGRISSLRAFQQGLFRVQDRAAQVAGHLLAPGPGERILDLCAGLGGKTTHLAELAGNMSQVVALDINPTRLLHLLDASGRLGLRNIWPVAADASKSLSGLFREAFQAVLVDAPCSGLGVLSRHPDGKWNKTDADPARLAGLQKDMLRNASKLLCRGGRLLFITCTITQEENQGVVHRFLEEQGDMEVRDLRETAPGWAHGLIDSEGFFRTFPHVHGMDGFFGALFVKN